MTEHNPYPAQVADLVTQAFSSLADGLARMPGDGREDHLAEANARFQAAQAIASLAHAHETRTLALATLAGLDPVKVEQAGPIPQEAYLAAAASLGLLFLEEGQDATLEALRAALAGDDPADADLGDFND